MAALWSTTPRYDGAPAVTDGGCGDPVGWLFGLLSIPTPAYATAAPTTSTGGVTGTAAPTGVDASGTPCEPTAPIVLAPTGPVTIVLGADVRFAQE